MNGNKSLYFSWLTALIILCLIGLYTTVRLFVDGHYLFNTNDVLIWSLPLIIYVFLALCSSGLTLLAAIPIVFGVKRYAPFAKRLVFLSIATLCGAFVAIALELGNIWHIFYILLSPNPSSPIWWMGVIYSVELVLLAIKFWRMHLGDWDGGLSKFTGVASFLCAVVAPLMIGSIFGITESRATYFGPVLPIYCFLMALLSGLALFILYSMVCQKVAGNKNIEVHTALYDEFSLMLKYVAGLMVVFTIVKVIIESATVVPEFLFIRKFEHPFGSILGFHTEQILGLFLPFILLLFSNLRKTVGGKILVGGLLWIGTLGIHMQIFISGQSHPIGPKLEQFPAIQTYYPSIWEWFVALFAVSVMLLLYTIGERYLKLEAASEI